MNRITNKNFKQMYPNVEKALKNAAFIALDAEFSGLIGDECSTGSLFDSPKVRYAKLKKNIEPFITIQFGLTVFIPKKGANTYQAESFDFHLLPRALPTRNRAFLFQSSAIEFLSSHDFDFNEFAHNGISYLDKADEEELRKSFKDNTPLCWLREILSMKEQEEIEHCFKRVHSWLFENSCTDKILTMETSSFPIEYVLHKGFRENYKGIWTESSGTRTLSVIKVTTDVRTGLEKDNNIADKLDNDLLEYYTGFSKVVKLFTSLKKPIVGHNLLLDLMFMHKQFFTPLPKRYETFKSNINELFPLVYDTKHLSFELKNVLHKHTWKSNVLADLYSYFKDGPGKFLALNSPRIETPEKVVVSDGEKFHDAGWDSYCTGYCFIRMAHIFAVNKLSSSADMRDLTNTEIMAGVKDWANRVNLIRADLSHLRLDNPDPPSTRPDWLHVQSTINDLTARQIAQTLSCCGIVDVKKYTAKCFLVAVPNHRAAQNILKKYEKSVEFRVDRYNPLIHSTRPVKTLLLVGSLFFTGASVIAWIVGCCSVEP